MTIQPGTRLGPYEIVASIGAGGMGEVWRAKDTRLDRDVAIKILPSELAQNEQFLQRFDREAKAISQLNHPHVCTLYDVGEEGIEDRGSRDEKNSIASSSPLAPRSSILHYLVMELLEGESLADRVRKGPLPLHEVLRFGQQIASALDAAHRQGITHRDLKPGNIMITRSGAKLLDFGLAKTAAEGPTPIDGLTNMPTEAKPLTTEGTILGTFQYMAPEQLEGVEADARTDIFALGAVLYEMATGHRAFEGGSKTSLIAAIVSSQPAPISSVVAMAPPALDHVIKRCLEKDPEDRWQSAHDVASELRWIGEAGSQAGVAHGVTVRRKSRERIAWGLAAALAIVSALLGASRLMRVELPVRTFRATLTPPPGTVLVPFDQLGLAISPDGKRIAFVAIDEESKRRIWIRELSSVESRVVPETDGAWYPFWSPDGQYLGFFADGELRTIDLRGGSPRRIASAPTGRGGTWNASGSILFAPNLTSPINMVSAEGGEPMPVTTYDPEKHTTHRWPVFLPDGDHFLFVVRLRVEGRREVGQLRIASIKEPGDRVLIEDTTNALYVEPGYIVYGRGANLHASKFDAETLQVSGDPIPIVPEKLSYWEPKNFVPFAASNDGTLIYLPEFLRKSELFWFSRDGRRLESLGKAGYYGMPRISPDGKKIAYAASESAQGSSDLWIRDLEFGRSDRITQESGFYSAPAWSRDSGRLAYLGQPKGVPDLFIKSLRDGTASRLLYESPNWKISSSWLPDGSALVISEQKPQTNNDLLLVTVAEPAKIETILSTPFNESTPEISPDGRWLAYSSDSTGRVEVYVRGFAGGSDQWQISSDGGFGPRWRQNEIFYVAVDGRVMVVPIQTSPTFRPGQPTELFRLADPPTTGEPLFADVTPDGNRILMNLPTENRSALAFQLITNWTQFLERDAGGSN